MSYEENELQLHYERYREIIKGLTLMSDTFMRNVLKKAECAEYVLRIILEKDLKVVHVVVQQDNKNLQGRSAILDCVAQDESGNRFDVEVQQENEGASPKRARYHSGLLDMNTLNPGEDFDGLPESYVIFITKNDTLKGGFPIYHIERKIKETGESFGDQSHIIYVNSQIQEDTELGRLMYDFRCKSADQMHSETLARRVRELKETPEGVEIMCQEMEKIYNEGIEKGIEKGIERGIERGRRETAVNLSEMGMSVENIAKAVKVSVSVVQEWLAGGRKPV